MDFKHFLAALMVMAVWEGPASASGYGLREMSASAMGAAYAGSTAGNDDPTYMPYNPASGFLSGTPDFAANIAGIFVTSEATYQSATTAVGSPAGGTLQPPSFISNAAIPTLAGRLPLADGWGAGLVVTAPWGLSTDYPAAWAGRYHALETKLLTINATPLLSYRVSPRFVIAAGPQIQFAKGTLSSAVDMGSIGAIFMVPGSVPGGQDGMATFDAEDWGFGLTLGAVAEPADGVSLGLSYRSGVSHTMEGPLNFDLDGAGIGATLNAVAGLFADTNARTALTTPDTVNFGVRTELTDEWTALFELDWTNWSRFGELRIISDNLAQPDDITTASWKDSWFAAVGAEYRPDADWSFRAGLGFDQSPVPDSTRNPRIPDADRILLSGGVTRHVNTNLDIMLTGMHLFIADKNIQLTAALPGNSLRGSLTGSSGAEVNVLSFQLVYRR